MVDNTEILEYAKKINGEKQAWIGANPQFDMDIALLESCTNFRLPSKFHGIYDTVWLYEKPLNEYHVLSWKIILDEAIRLLKENGRLVIKIAETAEITVPAVKNFLGRNINLDVSIDYEYQKDGLYTIVFNIKRQNFEIYQDKTWTFAMLTGGQKDDVVIKFLESIRNNESTKSQIIISGPKKEIYDRFDVEYLDLSQYRDDKYAEISRKKNDIAKMASGANILIAHDRYYLNDNFFNDFEKYGYDFDFLAMRQISAVDNKEYPYYCYYYNHVLGHTHVGSSNDYMKLFDTQYINGGLMVFKTKTLSKLRFNSLIFWNQKEDVEITLEFMKNSIIPRVNFYSNIYTERPSNEFPFDIFDGQKFIYNAPVTQKEQPILFGISSLSRKKIKIISFRTHKKTKFPFFGVRLKFFKEV